MWCFKFINSKMLNFNADGLSLPTLKKFCLYAIKLEPSGDITYMLASMWHFMGTTLLNTAYKQGLAPTRLIFHLNHFDFTTWKCSHDRAWRRDAEVTTGHTTLTISVEIRALLFRPWVLFYHIHCRCDSH